MRLEGLHGVIAPVPTPFDVETGEVAAVAVREIARALLSAGLHGIVVSGSTGEGELLDEDERARLVEWMRGVVPDDRWLIAGAGAESTRAAVRIAREAASAGADAVLVRPPAYYGALLSPSAVADHYSRLADGSPIPLVLYNIPKYTHLMLQDSVLRAVAEHEKVIGFKDSSADLKVLAGYRAAAPRLAALVGSGSHFYPALEMGANGGVLAVACFAAAPCAQLYAAFREGDRVAAGSLQERLDPLAREIVGGMGPAGIKVAMDAVGLPGGPPRPPLEPLGPRQVARVSELVSAAGLRAAA